MAITPRTITRNPLLLLLFSTFAIAAFAFVFQCPTKTSCHASKAKTPPIARTAAVKTVSVATLEAAKSTAPGWLGVEIQTLNPERAKLAGVQAKAGVLVLGVQDGRPAAVAGFKPYDVIVGFNGTPMKNSCQLKRTVASTAAGSKVAVQVIREGRRMILHPTLADKDGVGGCGNACK